jgi:hypothetical protein
MPIYLVNILNFLNNVLHYTPVLDEELVLHEVNMRASDLGL